MNVRQSSFALRVVRRRAGDAGVLYRRSLDLHGEERLTRIASLSPLAFSAATALLRQAVRATEGPGASLTSGAYHPLDPEWGARVACYALVARGLRDSDRLHRAAESLRHADGPEAAWWFGQMARRDGLRAIRAMRILIEAVR